VAVLPDLAWQPSPNCSPRTLHRGQRPYLIVWHRPVGSYHGSVSWLCDPRSQASAHVVTEGNGTGVDEATQLVPWHLKAWHASSFNSISYGLEGDDDAWNGADSSALQSIARVTGFICLRTGIPCQIAKNPLHDAGIVTHAMLGRAGGGHTDPTGDDLTVIRKAIRLTQREIDRGGYRRTWGRGSFYRIEEH
jgi:hypothetical protein